MNCNTAFENPFGQAKSSVTVTAEHFFHFTGTHDMNSDMNKNNILCNLMYNFVTIYVLYKTTPLR